jgi:hypothetical protein
MYCLIVNIPVPVNKSKATVKYGFAPPPFSCLKLCISFPESVSLNYCEMLS